MRRLLGTVLMLAILLPISAFALEGIGPRITIQGVIEKITITKEQKDLEYGGEMLVRARNGQLVTVLFTKDTEIIAEGRSSRHQRLPIDLRVGTDIRTRGWRLGADSLTASLVIVTNASLNPALTTSGILQAIGKDSITIIGQNGGVATFGITNETDIMVNFTLRGMDGLNLVGKQVLITLNANNVAQARVVRITENAANRSLPTY